jgi:RNA recognition motif-containing protein
LEQGAAKGFGFVSYDNFESSDAAIEAMNGQYLMNKSITVSYAFKKDSTGERHGSATERLLAEKNKKNKVEGSGTEGQDRRNEPVMLAPISRAELANMGMGNAAAGMQQGYPGQQAQGGYGQQGY